MDMYTDRLKEPGPIASDFIQTFWDFGIKRKIIYCLEDKNVTSYGNH